MILLAFLLLKKVLSASSYGRTKVRIEFWSQCRILRVWTLANPVMESASDELEMRRIRIEYCVRGSPERLQ